MSEGVSEQEYARYLAVADQHPGETGVVGESVNDYGTTVSVLRCKSCGNVVSICPPTTAEKFGDDCLAEGCESYDIERDMDIWFEPMAEHGLIERSDPDD